MGESTQPALPGKPFDFKCLPKSLSPKIVSLYPLDKEGERRLIFLHPTTTEQQRYEEEGAVIAGLFLFLFDFVCLLSMPPPSPPPPAPISPSPPTPTKQRGRGNRTRNNLTYKTTSYCCANKTNRTRCQSQTSIYEHTRHRTSPWDVIPAFQSVILYLADHLAGDE